MSEGSHPHGASPSSPEQMQQRAEEFRRAYGRVHREISKVIVGHSDIVHGVLTCLFVGGHALLEGVPGLGKTLLVRTLAQVLDLAFSRIQFTPDLMPSDIIGTNIINETPEGQRVFSFQRGPIFAQIVLADEINRATPKTQSALLEAMQEHSVTVGGTIHKLQEPFFVMATQNPLEQEGTYPLPEAQLDRFFFKLLVNYSGREELATILERTTAGHWPQVEKVLEGETILRYQQLVREVLVAKPVQDYAIRLTLATHPGGEFAAGDTNKYIRCGSSPRGAQALVLAAKVRALLEGRYNVSFEDIRKVYLPALRHRILLNFEAQAENIPPDAVLQQILKGVPEVPVPAKV
jgi:MoxR-like ATPase